jgi:hypothetical protein
VIDPTVVFSSYSGSTADNWGYTATYDSHGNLYGGGEVAFSSGVMTDRQDEVDVALLCPHLEYPAKTAVKEGKIRIPLFILPMRMYGLVDIENFVEEAEDVLELWKAGAQNPITFPDEPRSMTATRNVSHRRWLAQQRT